MKSCAPCGRVLPLDAFWNAAGNSDGKQSKCKECQKKVNTAYRQANPEASRKYVKKWGDANRDHLRAASRARYWADPEKARAASLAKQKERKPKIAEYMRNRRASVPAVALRQRMSAQIRGAIGAGKSRSSVFSLLGYGVVELREHLERQFTKGMAWENMDKWHIDHIVPLSAFEVSGKDCPNLRKAWALTNLRPLWAAENIAKRDKREFLV